MKVKELDELLGTPARLAIVASLAHGQQLTFTALREETGLADGNLHVQTRRLTAAGYLISEPARHGNRTVTRFELTERGRLAFQDLVRRLHDATDPFGLGRRRASGSGSERDDRSQVW